MKKMWNYLGRNRKFFILTLLVGIVYSAISVALPTISGNLITTIVSNFAESTTLLIIFILVSLLQVFLAQLDLHMGSKLKIKQKQLMRKEAFHAFSLNESASREDNAEFTSFVNNDIPSVAEQYFMGTIDIIKCVSIILFSAVSLIYVHWLLAIIIVGISYLIVFLPKTMRKRSGVARQNYSKAMAQYNTALQSSLGGLKVIKAYLYRNRAGKLLSDTDDFMARNESVLLKNQLIIQGITTFLQVAKTVCILVVGAVLVVKKIVPVGALVTIIQLADVISAPIEVLAYLHHSRNEMLPLLKQYETMTQVKEHKEGKENIENVKLECMSIKQLSYKIDNLEILKNVTANFHAGKKYLIAGVSGSGKSTLLRLISQIGDLSYSGGIFWDKTEIRNIDYSSFFGKVSPVFQEPYLFYATLEENILLGRPISADMYHEVIKKLNLEYLLERYGNQEITPEVMDLLSGGEKQRVALARAMVGKPEVYLLDEVTSALDEENAYNIEELILKEDAMVIHISHKPNSKLSVLYDERFILEQGMLRPISD